MARFLVGLVVGSVGTAAGIYGLFALLPATRETPERERLVGPRDPDTERWSEWTALQGEEMCVNCVTPWKCNGPHVYDTNTSGDGHARWIIADTPST